MKQRSLVRDTGWAYFPIAFIARLPFAMMVVGVMMLVVGSTGSVSLGGYAAAATGLGVVIAGPLIGDLVDRFGQRRVLLPLAIVGGTLLALFPIVVMAGGPDALVLAMAATLGLTAPQAAALSRTRLMAIASARYGGARLAQVTSRLMSYESAADETAFVVGPVLVGVLASLVAAWAPIAAAAALTLVFVTAFALHPSARMVPIGVQAQGPRAPLREMFAGSMLVLIGGSFGIGLVFGTTLTSLTAAAERSGHGDIVGLLYGAMGAGSAVLALSVMFLPPRFRRSWRWLVFATVLFSGALAYAVAPDLVMLTVTVGLMGLGIGPTLVTIFSLAGDRSPAGRSATTMTAVGSAAVLAQALAASATGWLAERHPDAVMAAPAGAAAVVLMLGMINAICSRR